MVVKTKEERLAAVLAEARPVARWYETVKGTFRVQVPGICPTEGTDWGGFSLTLATTGPEPGLEILREVPVAGVKVRMPARGETPQGGHLTLGHGVDRLLGLGDLLVGHAASLGCRSRVSIQAFTARSVSESPGDFGGRILSLTG